MKKIIRKFIILIIFISCLIVILFKNTTNNKPTAINSTVAVVQTKRTISTAQPKTLSPEPSDEVSTPIPAKTPISEIPSNNSIVTEVKSNTFEMQDTPQSSCFSEVGYNPGTETLRVCFRTSGYYLYYNFSQDDYDKFIAADSLGTYYNKNIKGLYPYEREVSNTSNTTKTSSSKSINTDYDSSLKDIFYDRYYEIIDDYSDEDIIYEWFDENYEYYPSRYSSKWEYFEDNFDEIYEEYCESIDPDYLYDYFRDNMDRYVN